MMRSGAIRAIAMLIPLIAMDCTSHRVVVPFPSEASSPIIASHRIRRPLIQDLTFTFAYDRPVEQATTKTLRVSNNQFALVAVPMPPVPLRCVQGARLRFLVLDGSGYPDPVVSAYLSSIAGVPDLRDGDSLRGATILDVRPRADATLGPSRGWVEWNILRHFREWDALGLARTAGLTLELRPPTFAEPRFSRTLASTESGPASQPIVIFEVLSECSAK
jgi:hypothetical protein